MTNHWTASNYGYTQISKYQTKICDQYYGLVFQISEWLSKFGKYLDESLALLVSKERLDKKTIKSEPYGSLSDTLRVSYCTQEFHKKNKRITFRFLHFWPHTCLGQIGS